MVKPRVLYLTPFALQPALTKMGLATSSNENTTFTTTSMIAAYTNPLNLSHLSPSLPQ